MALGLRLIFWVFVAAHPEKAFENDSTGYIQLAGTLLDSHSFPSIVRTPTYPFFIASIFSLFGRSLQAVLFLQCSLDSITAVLVSMLFLRICQDARYAFIAGLLYAVNPFAVFYSNMVLTETLFTFILAAAIYCFIVSFSYGRRSYLIVSSILIGIAILCRPIALYVPFLLAFWVLLAGHKFRGRVRSSLIFVIVSYAVMVPWYAKNYRDYGRWTLSTIGDLNYVISFAPEVLMLKDDPRSVTTFNVNEKIAHFQGVLRSEAARRYAGRRSDPHELADDSERSVLLLDEAKSVVYKNLPLFLVSHAVNIGRVLLPYHPQFEKITGFNSRAISVIPFALDFLIMGFFAIGVVISLKRFLRHKTYKEALIIMIILIAYFSFVPGIVGYARFRIPVLPYISIFSALGFAGLFEGSSSIRFGKEGDGRNN